MHLIAPKTRADDAMKTPKNVKLQTKEHFKAPWSYVRCEEHLKS